MSPRSMQALGAGIKTLTTNRRRALDVLRMATDEDPSMADAWLARMAAGDTSVSTLARLSGAAGRIGQDLRALGAGYTLRQLDVAFDLGYVRWPIEDTTSARLAYVAALLHARDFEQASEVLETLERCNRVLYAKAQLMDNTERWPDVLGTVTGCESWSDDPFLRRAASLLEGKAAANLGLFDRAAAALIRAADALNSDVLVRDALYLRGLVARCQGDEALARDYLSDVAARWPDYQTAKEALADSTFSLHVVDHATIDSRTDRWDPATGTTPNQRAAAEHASAARQQLDDAAETLKAMVGLDAVKQQVATLRATTTARILRRRKGIPTPASGNHMLMVGPPGVGKTETARAVGKIFCGLGILPRADVYETSKGALSGQHVGEIETLTRDFLSTALGGTVFFDEFGELLHGGYAGGDPVGQAIIGEMVPWMENNRDKAVLIAAGYPRACQRVLDFNKGFTGRFATTIVFDSYQPDELIAIAEAIIARNHATVEPGALDDVLLGPFTRFYTEQHPTAEGDTIRTIDILNNGRFVRNIVEASQNFRDLRVVTDLDIGSIDLNDDTVEVDVSLDKLSLLTREDLHSGLQQVLPPAFRS
jgi:type VII secretion ATPase EccA